MSSTATRAPLRGWIVVPPQLRAHLLFCPTRRRAAKASRARGWRVYRLGADQDGDPVWALEPALPLPSAPGAPERLAELAHGADDDPPAAWISHPDYLPTTPPPEADRCTPRPPARAPQPSPQPPQTRPRARRAR